MNTKTVGELSEAVITAELLKIGYTVLRPHGDNQRYDLVIDSQGIFKRIQCKTAHIKKGAIEVKLYNTNYLGKTVPYKNQVEYVIAYCPDNDKCYLLDPWRFGLTATLRVDATSNQQKRGINWAVDYEL